jgi:hypothetical protein
MNGRIYDPILGRFLSPDPLIQAPDMTQSLNRYAYCLNNPLTLTDPSGYSWVGNTFAAITGIAVALETGGLAAGLEGAIIRDALGGASAAMMSSVINGANFRQTAKNTYTGAFWGAFSSCVSYEIGDISNVYARIAAHTAAEGAMEGIRGGHVEHGMLVGFTSSVGGYYINRYGSQLGTAGKVAANAALSGVVSEIGGGKFASGAMTGAFIIMYNELQHEILRSYLKRYTKRSDAYKDMIAYSISTDNEIAAFYTENNGTIVYYNSNNKNNYSYHPHVYMDNTGKHYIKFNGKAIYITGEVHTHPMTTWGTSDNPLRISEQDCKLAWGYFDGRINILIPHTGDLYKVYLRNGKNNFDIIPKTKWNR